MTVDAAEEREARRGGWFARAVLCLLAAVAWIVLVVVAARPLSSSAAFLAVETGRIPFEWGAPPHRDTFTHTAAGRPWVPGGWLSASVLAGMDDRGGAVGLRLFGGIVALLAIAVVSTALWRRAPDLPRAAAGTVLASALLLPAASPAPDLLGALAGLLLYLGLTGGGDRARFRVAAPAALLAAAGANLSPLALLALPLLALRLLAEAAARVVRRRRGAEVPPARPFAARAATLAAAAAGSLANPLGVQVWTLLAQDLTARYSLFPGRGPFPLLPADPVGLAPWTAALVALAILVLNLAGWLLGRSTPLARPALPAALASLGAALLALFDQRLLWLLVVPVVEALRAGSPFSALLDAKGIPRMLERAAGRLAAAAAVALLLLPLAGDARVRGTLLDAAAVRPYLARVDRAALPVGAVTFARAAGLSGRLFHEPAWGGYLAHALPGSPTFLDERAGLFPRRVLDAAERIEAGGRDAGRVLQDYGVELVIVRRDFPMPEGGGDWTPVFRNQTAAVLVCRGARGWQNLAKAAAYYREQGLPQESADTFVEGAILEASPDWARRFDLLDPAPLARALGLYAQLRAAAGPEAQLPALRQLGNLYARLGLHESALREWRRGLRIQPRDPNLLWNLAVSQIRLRRFGEARRSLQTYLALHPGDAEAERAVAALDQLPGFGALSPSPTGGR